MKSGSTYLYVIALFLITGSVYGQKKDPHELMGQPFNTRTFADNGSFTSNESWAIVQNKKGLVYAANHNGILEFDGYTWRVLEIDGVNSAFSLDIDENDLIYIGAKSDFGFLAPGASGGLEYVSLLPHVPEAHRDFLDVWGTHVTSHGVYFQEWKRIFRWDGKTVKVWESDQRLHTSFEVYDRFFVKQDSTGLLELVGDELRLVPGGEQFANTRIFMMESFPDGSILLGTQEGISGPLSLYTYSEGGIHEISSDLHLVNSEDAYTFYSGVRLDENYFALATIYDGVFVIDKNGRLVETLGESRSIPGDVTSVYKGRQGGIWMTHYTSGITHIGTPFSLSVYPGPGGRINAMQRFGGRLYLATGDGLYTLADRRKEAEGDAPAGFEYIEVERETRARFSMIDVNDELLVATAMGVYSLSRDTDSPIAFGHMNKPRSFLQSTRFDGRIYVGLQNGLGVMSYSDGDWVSRKVGSINKTITSMAEAPDGSLWVSTYASTSKVWQIQFDEQGEVVKEREIESLTDFPIDDYEVELFSGKIGIVAPPFGVLTASSSGPEDEEVWLIDETLSGKKDDLDSLLVLEFIDRNTFWALYPDRFTVNEIGEDGQVATKSPAVLNLPDWKKITDVFQDEDGVLWISDNEQVYRYDPAFGELDYSTEKFSLMMRSVSVAWTDSVLFSGIWPPDGAEQKLHLRHEDNDLRFEYALPDYQRAEPAEYQYKLVGYDDRWSSWSEVNHVTLRNIRHGSYQFLVRARLRGEVVNDQTAIAFHIRPPWYASWWMVSVYVCFFGAGIWIVFRFVVTRRKLAYLEQERAYYERLNLANEQLRTANNSLKEASKMKDEFLANASHELRTPLTAILGFTSVLKEELTDEHHEFVGLIDENGKRLLQTINSLLDLTKLRAGMVQLKMVSLEVNTKVEEVVELLQQLAKNRNISLGVKKSNVLAYALLDEHNFERVLYNLIGNAIKFTPEGTVCVHIELGEEEVLIHVEDTGIGIDEKFIPFLFDEFKQEPSVDVQSEGSGLGLAISAKLVDLMNGTIHVKSEKGKGSIFTIAFPLERIEAITGEKKLDKSTPPSSQFTIRSQGLTRGKLN